MTGEHTALLDGQQLVPGKPNWSFAYPRAASTPNTIELASRLSTGFHVDFGYLPIDAFTAALRALRRPLVVVLGKRLLDGELLAAVSALIIVVRHEYLPSLLISVHFACLKKRGDFRQKRRPPAPFDDVSSRPQYDFASRQEDPRA